MPNPDLDPRVFFAAERTLLAWLRTGLTIMAFGFVVARFGLFLRLLSLQSNGGQHGPTVFSSAIGIALVLAGSLSVLFATIQHRRFIATLPSNDLPASYSRVFAVACSTFVGCVGIALAVYLAISGN